MRKKIVALLTASAMTAAFAGCGNKNSSSSKNTSETASVSNADQDTATEGETLTNDMTSSNDSEATTAFQINDGDEEKTTDTDKQEAATEAKPEHVSPKETVSANLGSQVTVDQTISKTDGSNTIKIPLADLIEDGDEVDSFTFVIYSADGNNIGEFKGGCGVSVTSDCPASTDTGWYQSSDFSAPTQGTYGEITWNVPSEIRQYISAGGELLFGYWWGNASNIRIECVVCSHSRKKELPVDGTASFNVGKSVSYNAEENTISVPTGDLLPENAVPQAVTYNISSSGPLGKFTGAFGYRSSKGYVQSKDTAVMTNSSNLSLTWFVSDEAKANAEKNGEIVLGYWWSKQSSINLDSITVKYSTPDGSSAPSAEPTTDAPAVTTTKKPSTGSSTNPTTAKPAAATTAKTAAVTTAKAPTVTTTKKPSSGSDKKPSDSSFRSSAEIVKAIKVGWNLGNSLESYNTGTSGLSTETGWGNPKTTKEIIKTVKDAGFNAIRVPATWGEHMNGTTIDSAWLARVKEVVDMAYNENMFVILNMHHDDYIWFDPVDSEYSSDSAKLKTIWKQVAEYFKGYGDRLLFEGMNEPRSIGSAKEWIGGTPEERAVVNKYEADFVDTVRKTGGNNSQRTLIITSYAASADTAAINDVSVPNSKNIVLSVHYYAPWRFSDGQVTSFDQNGKSELDAKFAELKQKFIDKGTPVIIGEFGCIKAADASVRREYYRYYVSAAKKNGIKCFVWDNNISSGEQSFGLLNRRTLKWNDDLQKAVVEGAK